MALYEQECLSIQKSEWAKLEKKISKDLEDWHKFGKTATQISKYIQLAPEEIRSRIEGLGLQPHFDKHLSTEEEITEYHKEQERLEKQEEADKEQRKRESQKFKDNI